MSAFDVGDKRQLDEVDTNESNKRQSSGDDISVSSDG